MTIQGLPHEWFSARHRAQQAPRVRRFFLDEVTVSHRQFDGTMSADSRFIFERGDAVAALILNRDSGEVVLVEQFWVPTWRRRTTAG